MNLAERIPRESLTGKVYQHLKAQLAGRTLNIGDRVNARQIAAELNVSRTTANKAIDQLIADGLVKTDASRHPVVAALPAKLKVHESSQFEFLNQTDSTYERLLERLLRGDYGAGDIIKERPLALDIGVNPATVRRAAEWLRAEGLLERLPRRGWRVTLLSPRDMRDAYRIRLMLEPPAVQGAVNRILEEQLDELEQQTQRLIDLGERATVFDRREADHEFHKTLCEASGNIILAHRRTPHPKAIVDHDGRLPVRAVDSIVRGARRDYQRLAARDEKLAVKRMKAHLRNAMRFNAEMWERRPPN